MTRYLRKPSTGLAGRPAGALRLHRGLVHIVPIAILTATVIAGQSRPEAFSTITIVTEAGANVALDNGRPVTVGRNGEAVFDQVRPGQHRVRVTQEGRRPFERTVTVSPGEAVRIEARLSVIPGSLEILTTAEASVAIDGEPRGKADARGVLRVSGIKPGERRVSAERFGFQRRETVVNVREDLELTVTLELVPIALPSPSTTARTAVPVFTVSRTIDLPTYPGSVSISPDASWFASCSPTSNHVAFWDVLTGRLKAEADRDSYSLDCTRMIASRERLAYKSGSSLAILDPVTRKRLQSVRIPQVRPADDDVTGAAFDDSGRRLAIANWAMRVAVVELESGRVVWNRNLDPDERPGEALLLAFSPDGRSLAAVGSHVFLILDSETGSVKADLTPSDFELGVETAVWSRDGRWIVGPGEGQNFQL